MKLNARILLFVLILPPLLLAVFYERILLGIGNFLIIEDKLHPANVIHVIAGDDYRTDYAIELYKQGYAKYIFFTGGKCSKHGYYHGEHGEQYALERGVPPEAIAIDDTFVTSTYSETIRLKDWIDKSAIPIRSVIVVSDPFHMRRARWTYRRVLGNDVVILMAPVPFIKTPYQQHWWRDGWQSKQYVKEEYLKLIYYIARYQLSWGTFKEWLAKFDTE